MCDFPFFLIGEWVTGWLEYFLHGPKVNQVIRRLNSSEPAPCQLVSWRHLSISPICFSWSSFLGSSSEYTFFHIHNTNIHLHLPTHPHALFGIRLREWMFKLVCTGRKIFKKKMREECVRDPSPHHPPPLVCGLTPGCKLNKWVLGRSDTSPQKKRKTHTYRDLLALLNLLFKNILIT